MSELVFDPAFVYRDKDGDEWEHIDGRWITALTHAERVDNRNMGLGHDGLPADYGPYTRIEEETTND